MKNKVKVGNRNNTLFGVAFKKVYLGERDSLRLREILSTYNDKYCDPPLAQYEIKAIVGDVLNKVKG